MDDFQAGLVADGNKRFNLVDGTVTSLELLLQRPADSSSESIARSRLRVLTAHRR
jgi:hypothetical protein